MEISRSAITAFAAIFSGKDSRRSGIFLSYTRPINWRDLRKIWGQHNDTKRCGGKCNELENGRTYATKTVREVWMDPVTKVAKRYGLSDVGLKKICKKLAVATPPLGYWARLRNGQNPSRPALKEFDAND
jgi:hypothetical protein